MSDSDAMYSVWRDYLYQAYMYTYSCARASMSSKENTLNFIKFSL